VNKPLDAESLGIAFTLTAGHLTRFTHNIDITPTSQILQKRPSINTISVVESLGGESLTGRNPGVIKAPS